jgi:hypothetical protein
VSRRLRRVVCLLAAAAILAGGIAYAQRGFGRFFRPRVATADSFDGAWNFCRLAYQGDGWSTDYPDADYNFTIRLSELTRTHVSREIGGEVRPLIVRPTDEALFQCPFVMLWQAETLEFDNEDAARLREYLLKGGFLWADDSWGSYAWDNFAREMAKVLPPSEYPFTDVPRDHPLLRAFYPVPEIPQIPGIGFWGRSGGRTSERGADSAEVHVRGMFDKQGRLMVLNTHNTDVADGWEEEATDPRYFYAFSTTAYAIGIDILIYVMTH